MLRHQSAALEEAFNPVMRWWENSSQLRTRTARFFPASFIPHAHLNEWCDVSEFQRSFTMLKLPPPDCFDVPRTTEITVLHWRIRMINTAESIWPARGCSWADRVRIPGQIYRCVLRRLKHWICRHEQWTETQFDDALFADVGEVRDARPRMLALRCLRVQLEERAWVGGPFDFRTVKLSDAPQIDLKKHQGRTPRAAWRAAFFAMYATWYLRVLKSINSTAPSLRFGEHADEGLLYWSSIEYVDDETWAAGEFTFPMLDDLHLFAARSRSEPPNQNREL